MEQTVSTITFKYNLLFAMSVMLFCWLVGYILDKRKIYVRV